MSGILPGRMGTLNKDQEQHLKEMWLVILVFLGYAPKDLTTVATLSSIYTNDTQKHKKRGLLHRKQKSIGIQSPDIQIETFRQSLNNMKTEQFDLAMRKMIRADQPDNLLLRFLRARKWDVAKGLGMFGSMIAWRQEEGIEEIVEKGELLGHDEGDDGIIQQLIDGKSQVHGVDKNNRPIVYIASHMHKPKAQSEESVQKYTIMVIENTRLCMRDPIDTAAVIFDLGKFTMSNMDYGALKYILKCFEAHYPESLGFVLIHRAPWIFSGIWSAIKGYIDPDVAAKISFTKNEKDLLKFIDSSQLGKTLGGKREWDYEYVAPSEQENKCLKENPDGMKEKYWKERSDLFDQFFDATASWCKSTGSESNKYQQRKDEIAEKIRQNYWKLDPYVRATSIMDRDGTFEYFHQEINFRPDSCAVPDTIQAQAVRSLEKAEHKNHAHPKHDMLANGTAGVNVDAGLKSEKTLANGTSGLTANRSVPAKHVSSRPPPPTTAPPPIPVIPFAKSKKEIDELSQQFGIGLSIINEEGENDVFFDAPEVIFSIAPRTA